MLCFLFLTFAVYSSNTWEWINRLPQGNNLNSIVGFNNKFYAVGDCETIMTSDRGTDWTIIQAGGRRSFKHIQVFNGRMIAAGDSGMILTSTDGVGWDTAVIETDINLNCMTTFKSTLYISDGRDTILTTDDGINWAKQAIDMPHGYKSFASNDSIMVAVTTESPQGSRELPIATSTDGINWTKVNKMGTEAFDCYDIVWNGKTFIVAGSLNNQISGSGGRILTSENGLDWTELSSGGSYLNISQIDTITYIFGNGSLKYSTDDGQTWTWPSKPNLWTYVRDVATVNGKWVVVGDQGLILSGDDHTTFIGITDGTDSDFTGLAYGNGIFAAITDGSTSGGVHTSEDGVTWPFRYNFNSNPLDICFSNGNFFVCTTTGAVYRSSDGINWSVRSTGISDVMFSIFGRGPKIISVGRNGRIIYSGDDGSTWSSRSSGTSAELHGVDGNDSLFIAVGKSGTVVASTDGITWEKIDCPFWDHFNSVVWNGEHFVIVASSGRIYYTKDGTDFRRAVTIAPAGLTDVHAHDSITVAAGGNGVFVISEDDVNWTTIPTITTNGIDEIEYQNGKYVMVGGAGTIISSITDIIPDKFTGAYVDKLIPDIEIDEDAPDTSIAKLDTIFTEAVDGSDLTFEITCMDSFLLDASIDNSDSTILISVKADTSGNTKVAVIATNGAGHIVTDTFSVKVNSINDAPVVTAKSDTTISEGQDLSIGRDLFNAVDVDNPGPYDLTFDILPGDNFSIHSYLSRITPDSGFIGDLFVEVKFSDGQLSDTAVLTVHVEPIVAITVANTNSTSMNKELLFAPNPVPPEAKEVYFITPSDLSGEWEVTIFDNIGNVIDRAEFNSNGGFTYKWDLRNMQGIKVTSGLYLAKITWKRPNGSVEIFKRYVGVEK